MTRQQEFPQHSSRTRWLKIATAAWLLLISTVAIVNSVGLSHLMKQIQGDTQDVLVKTLGSRVTDLELQASASKGQPAPVSQADFTAARRVLEEKLAQLEEAHSASNTLPSNLQALQARVAGIENQLQKIRPAAAAAPRRAMVVTKPTVLAPPFQVIGWELRGGERFLAITPIGATSLSGARLLREGDAEAGWQLQSIEARAAVFRVDGEARRIAVP